MTVALPPRPAADSVTEMVQVVLPNDANPLGFILGGSVMHLMDIAGAIASFRHTRQRVVTAAVDGLQFLHPIKVGDLIILRAEVSATFSTSLEVAVHVWSEEALTGDRRLTSQGYLTFVAIDERGQPVAVPPLLLSSAEDEARAEEAEERRHARLQARDAMQKPATSETAAKVCRGG